ncbi:MAG: [FeFe] hydrogenase H-cluster maturation GTPase HydF [Treponema sp.]|jgi:[FeFe] hydrogenase H-cluster maturation GTPase HydF|nr:[FeFe] hydrogenase H-cluster maturation GTPase HydF [Treponema sp.]
MGLNESPSSERVHIGFFGQRNTGKSSLVNAVTGQDLAIVSEIKGTTTDPVLKAMELLPMGPVVIIDTPGIDDRGILGEKRVQKTYTVLQKTDIAVLVVDGQAGKTPIDESLIDMFKERHINYLVAYNKSDLLDLLESIPPPAPEELYVSAKTGFNINTLKERIAAFQGTEKSERKILSDLIEPGDCVVLVIPIDSAAPKGRLILPQQQAIRDILERGAIACITRETELTDTLNALKKKPALVVTDSQAFAQVQADTAQDIPLTSFSILFARYKGLLNSAVEYAKIIDHLNDGDRVLISEGCTHHRQCDDIGTVKLPKWLHAYTGKNLHYEWTSGGTFPKDLSPYKLVIHCGGCMLPAREMHYRQQVALEQTVPITNYGIIIAYMNGILERALRPLNLTTAETSPEDRS